MTDIIELDRIKKAITSTKGFLNKIFTEKEIELFSLFGDDFKNKKAEIIKSIVEKHPFNDQK